MEISWYGTAALCMSHAGHKILFDPFVSRNPHSPRISVPELAQMGDIFITHGHFDHTLDVPEVAALGKSKVYCSAETARQLIKRGAPAQQVVAISPGDTKNQPPFPPRVLKAHHKKKLLIFIIPYTLPPGGRPPPFFLIKKKNRN